MAHISGTFSNASPGKLRIKLTGRYFEGSTYRDAGFPSSGTRNYTLGATINSVAMTPIDRFVPEATAEMDYPGGGASWAVATTTVATQTSGLTTYGFTDLKLTLTLIKR